MLKEHLLREMHSHGCHPPLRCTAMVTAKSLASLAKSLVLGIPPKAWVSSQNDIQSESFFPKLRILDKRRSDKAGVTCTFILPFLVQ